MMGLWGAYYELIVSQCGYALMVGARCPMHVRTHGAHVPTSGSALLQVLG